jgi:glucose-1-phosphatase
MKKVHPIKNIIFDLGGVILDIDYQLTSKAFMALGLKNFDDIYSQKKQQHFFDDFEKGILSVKRFRKEIKNYLPERVTNENIDDAWNSMLLTIPVGRIDWLNELNRKYRIFLLSNTNEIHKKAFRKIVNGEVGYDVFDDVFEKCYYSSELKMRKPDTQIFIHVLEQSNLNPSETLFIDDSPQHVNGAQKAGIHAIHLQLGKKVEDLVSELLSY